MAGIGYKSILVISDQHYPYNHPDIYAFLKALAVEYCPQVIVNLGDELDYHGISFHPSDQDLFSAGDELKAAKIRLKPIMELFPKMHLLESNHGSLVYRRAKHDGLPLHVLKSYKEILEAPNGWTWHDELVLPMSDGNKVYFCHGKSSDVLKHSQMMGMSVVTGHFHEKFVVRYWANTNGLYWACIAGCLIENRSHAFAYNKLNLKRPMIGTVVIINGHPKLCPMILNKHGRWIGKIV